MAGIGRVAVQRPQPAHRLPVDRERRHARPGADRAQGRERRLPGRLVGAEGGEPDLGEEVLETGLVGAFGQPDAAGGAEPAPVRADRGLELQQPCLAGRDQRQQGMGRGRGDELDAPGGGPERVERLVAELLEPLEPSPVALRLGPAGGLEGRVYVLGIALGRADAELAHEVAHARGRRRVLELVGEDRGDRDRQVVGDLEHRQVRAHERVEQPLLAERIGPEALDVGHVGVQDDRDVARVRGAAHARQTATKSSAASRSASASVRSAKSAALIAAVNRS